VSQPSGRRREPHPFVRFPCTAIRPSHLPPHTHTHTHTYSHAHTHARTHALACTYMRACRMHRLDRPTASTALTARRPPSAIRRSPSACATPPSRMRHRRDTAHTCVRASRCMRIAAAAAAAATAAAATAAAAFAPRPVHAAAAVVTFIVAVVCASVMCALCWSPPARASLLELALLLSAPGHPAPGQAPPRSHRAPVPGRRSESDQSPRRMPRGRGAHMCIGTARRTRARIQRLLPSWSLLAPLCLTATAAALASLAAAGGRPIAHVIWTDIYRLLYKFG